MKHTNSPMNRIVVKVGTSSLVSDAGHIDRSKVANLVGQISELRRRGREVVLVTSGAIRTGMEKLGFSNRPATIPEQQATAAVGQIALMQTYAELLQESGILPAQVLLTRDDFHNRIRYLNARNTLRTLIGFGCLPIVNENDTVATDEIKFGENDTLSALVAACVDADLLINLSDVDGLYDSDPRNGGFCRLIEEVKQITPQIEAIAGGTSGVCGTGGMSSKIEAAKIAVNSGVRMVIANASRPNVLLDIADGMNVGTRFLSGRRGLSQRKRWIAFGNRIRGSIVVNDGARTMLVEKGKSLLAVGVVGCEGDFSVGDLVAIVDEAGRQVARGITNYSAPDLTLIMGRKSTEIEGILGYKDYDEVVHRDNLVLGV